MSERYKLVAILWKGRKSRKVAKRSKSRTSKKASPKTWLIWYATLFLFSTCCCFLLYSRVIKMKSYILKFSFKVCHNCHIHKNQILISNKRNFWIQSHKSQWRLCIHLLYWLLFLVPEHKVSWEAGSESQALSNWRRIFKWTVDTIEWSIFHDHGQ